MREKYFELVVEYFSVIVWFIVCIAAKLSQVSSRKKLTKMEVFKHIIYGIVGGVFAYYGTISFRHNFRVIALGVGVLAGDILVNWVMDNTRSLLDVIGEVIKKWIKRK